MIPRKTKIPRKAPRRHRHGFGLGWAMALAAVLAATAGLSGPTSSAFALQEGAADPASRGDGDPPALSDAEWDEALRMLRDGEKRKLRRWLEEPGIVGRANEAGHTMAFAIAHSDDVELIDLVLATGPDLAHEDTEGRTPLIYASDLGATSAVQRLLARGAEVDAIDEAGRSALTHAAVAGKLEVARALLEGGATVDLPDRNGATALVYACAKGFYALPVLLLEHGADPNVRTRDGATALQLAERQNAQRVARLLRRHGADG